MQAVVLGTDGTPRLEAIAEPGGPGATMRVLACGLCGSDVEKLRPEHVGAVLGHEVTAETTEGRRVALVHHRSCGTCPECRAGHESLCPDFGAPTIRPGGFAERVNADAWVELPPGLPDWAGTMAEPLACCLRGAERIPAGRVLIVGHGFVGRLFSAVLRARGEEVFAIDTDPGRAGPAPDGPVDAAVLSGPGGADAALTAVRPGGTVIVFADAGELPADPIYRGELTVVGVRSATPRHMEAAVSLLPRLDLPEPMVLPLAEFARGLDLYRRREALKVVFTP